jgi:hypothetical protein
MAAIQEEAGRFYQVGRRDFYLLKSLGVITLWARWNGKARFMAAGMNGDYKTVTTTGPSAMPTERKGG